MEMIIQPIPKMPPIVFNYEELKRQITERTNEYKTLQYTSEQIDLAKKDRANLNNLKKALNNERITRQKEYMEPFDKFASQVRELCELIDEPVSLIDKQIKEVEEREKQDKKDSCMKIFFGTEGLPDWLKYEQIENPKWYNKTTSIKAVTEEIEAKINHINVDIKMLSALPDFSFEAIEVYKETLDSGKALIEGNRLADIQKRKAAEAKAKEEAERKAEEIPFAPVPEEITEIKADIQEPERVWLKFEAYLSKDEAIELKAFFMLNNIKYQAIREEK